VQVHTAVKRRPRALTAPQARQMMTVIHQHNASFAAQVTTQLIHLHVLRALLARQAGQIPTQIHHHYALTAVVAISAQQGLSRAFPALQAGTMMTMDR
jgi:hypothetical protein